MDAGAPVSVRSARGVAVRGADSWFDPLARLVAPRGRVALLASSRQVLTS